MPSFGLKSRDFHPERYGLFIPEPDARPLPHAIEYGQLFAPVDDQGDFNTCVAHAFKGVLDAVMRKHSGKEPDVSWRALYATIKEVAEPHDRLDDGCLIEDAFSIVSGYGYVAESKWPDLGVTPANLLDEVPFDLFDRMGGITSLARVQSTAQGFMRALVGHGPIIIGSMWPFAWLKTDTDAILRATDSPPAGQHCTVITGYVQQAGSTYFHLRNSWGLSWGDRGYAWLDAAAISNVTNAYTVKIP